jgi:hypothetical protein
MESMTYEEFKAHLKTVLKNEEYEYVMGLWSDEEE